MFLHAASLAAAIAYGGKPSQLTHQGNTGFPWALGPPAEAYTGTAQPQRLHLIEKHTNLWPVWRIIIRSGVALCAECWVPDASKPCRCAAVAVPVTGMLRMPHSTDKTPQVLGRRHAAATAAASPDIALPGSTFAAPNTPLLHHTLY